MRNYQLPASSFYQYFPLRAKAKPNRHHPTTGQPLDALTPVLEFSPKGPDPGGLDTYHPSKQPFVNTARYPGYSEQVCKE